MATAWILNPLPVSAASTSSGTALGAIANVLNDYMGVVWKSTTATSATITFDMGSDVTLDTILLLGLVGPPTGAQMQIRAATAAQGSAFSGGVGTGANQYWQSAAENLYGGTIVPTSGKRSALWQAPASGGPPASRYWRVVISSMSASDYVQLSRAVLSRRFVPERNFVFGGAFGVRDFGKVDFSSRAVMLRRTAPKFRTVGVSFANARKDEVEATIRPLLELVGGTAPIALVTDPATDAQRENRIYFGPLVGDLGVVQRNAAGWEWRCNMVSLI